MTPITTVKTSTNSTTLPGAGAIAPQKPAQDAGRASVAPTVNPARSGMVSAPSPANRPAGVTVTTTPVTTPTITMAAQANRAAASLIPANILARLKKQCFDTRDINAAYFHCIIYGPTDARKTVTAAEFGTPENTRIILVRNKEQLIPLRSRGYKAFIAETWEHIAYALQYPEAIWPEWTLANFPDRTLILDDITEMKDIALDENETRDDGSEVKDLRQQSRLAKEDIRVLIKAVLRKPMHFIIVCLSREWDQTKSQGRIGPDLPQSIANLITTDFEFCFYIQKGIWKFHTGEARIQSMRKNDKGKDEAYVQTIFAKHKIAKELEGGKVIKPQEPLELRAIWERIQAATKGGVILNEIATDEVKDERTSGPGILAGEGEDAGETVPTVSADPAPDLSRSVVLPST